MFPPPPGIDLQALLQPPTLAPAEEQPLPPPPPLPMAPQLPPPVFDALAPVDPTKERPERTQEDIRADHLRQLEQDVRREAGYQAPTFTPEMTAGERMAVQGSNIATRAQLDASALRLRAAEELAAQRAKAEQDAAARKEAQAKAQERVSADRAAYQDVLKKGPDIKGVRWAALLGAAVADALGAALDPTGQSRPRTDRLVDQFLAANQERFQGQVAAAKDRVDAGQDDLDRLIGDQRQAQQDMATQRAAVYEELAQDLELRAQSASDELSALNAKNAAAMYRAKAQEEQRKAELDEQERQIGIATKVAGLGKTQAEIRKLDADTAKKLGAGGRKLADPLTTPKDLRGLTPEKVKEVRSLGVVDPRTGRFMRNPDGSFLMGNTPAEAAQLRDRAVSVKEVHDLVRQLIQLRREHGWESDMQKSPAWQRIKTTMGALKKANVKAAQLGSYDTGLQALLEEELTAGLDPTGWRDIEPALTSFLEQMENSFNTRLTGQTYQGERVDLPVPGTPESYRPTLEQIRPQYRTVANPKTGAPIPAKERIKGVAKAEEALHRDAGKVEGLKAMQRETGEEWRRAQADDDRLLDEITDLYRKRDTAPRGKAKAVEDEIRAKVRQRDENQKYMRMLKARMEKRGGQLSEQRKAEERREDVVEPHLEAVRDMFGPRR